MAKQASFSDSFTKLMSSALEEQFEEHSIDDDVLSALDGLEASRRNQVTLPPDICARIHPLRQLGLQFAYHYLTLHGYEHDPDAGVDLWFQVASILDRDMTWLLAHTEGEASIPLVLARASSVVLLALGLQSVEFDRVSICKALQSLACSYSSRLGGGPVKIIEIERSQYRLVKFFYRVPSVATWLSLYVERLRLCFAFLNLGRTYSLAALKNAALGLAKRTVSSALSIELSHQQIARSSLMLALFSTSLLPGDFFTQRDPAELTRLGLQRAVMQIVFKSTIDEIAACTAMIFGAASSAEGELAENLCGVKFPTRQLSQGSVQV